MAIKQLDYNLAKTGNSRIFLIAEGASPAHAPVYQYLARATGLTIPTGDITPIRIPSPDKYSEYVVAGETRAAPDLPTVNVEARMQRALSQWFKTIGRACEFDIQIHMGECQDPTDFNGGWDKVISFGRVRVSSYTTSDLGALGDGDEAPITETISLTVREPYEIGKLSASELAASDIVQEVVDVAICDSKQCGLCGIPSNGCERIFAVTKSHGGSPGLPAKVIFSEDGGSSWDTSVITSLAANEDPTFILCVGQYLVVGSNESLSLHYAAITDILDGTETWSEVSTGFVSSKGPNAGISFGQSFNFLVGNGGYIYQSDDLTSQVEVSDAGNSTVQNLNDIDGIDNQNLVVVGNSNVVLFTENGGESWSLVTGPTPGVALNAVVMQSKAVWLVGTAGGELWYTENQGRTWAEKAFPGSGAGQVRDLKFVTSMVGYMAHDTATPRGRILRTIDGGYSWYVLPESTTQTFPANDRINRVTACDDDINIVYGAGLGDNATDGFLVKAAGA